MKTGTITAFILTLGLLAACGGPDQPAEEPQDTASTTSGMQGMEGMQGMQGMGMGQSGRMMGEMRAHMQRMAGMSGDSAAAMLQMHRQMVANMIAQMNREMREMEMGTDPAWGATIDSLRSDLTRMPEMSPAELQQLMPEHRARMMRLMEMHQEMMEGM